jgi:hypothetical protein
MSHPHRSESGSPLWCPKWLVASPSGHDVELRTPAKHGSFAMGFSKAMLTRIFDSFLGGIAIRAVW